MNHVTSIGDETGQRHPTASPYSQPVTTAAPAPQRILAPAYAATTSGMFSLIVLAAFESLAVTTIMPGVARELDGVGLYALAFAAPLASGVVGMVGAGMWSDRRGPVAQLVASLVLFAAGLLVGGTAPSMEVLLLGRVLQGLGGGAVMALLYVVVGLVYPPRLQASVLAAFAAAWVLPALFGPPLAAWVAGLWSWRVVFLGSVPLVAIAGLLLLPAMRTLPRNATSGRLPLLRLVWAAVAATAVVGVQLLGDTWPLAGASLVVALVALSRLLPTGSLRLARGLPAVIATRGLLSAAFFCAEAYIVFLLEEGWGITPTRAGLALTAVGIVWAGASQVQARLSHRVSHVRAMVGGTITVLAGVSLLTLVVWLHLDVLLVYAAYVFAGAGMGFAYPRTGVAMLESSGDADRGANAAALTVSDSLGAALALAVTGVVFGLTDQARGNPFVAVLLVAVVCGVLGVAAASRSRIARA